jgi:hypothetical protein
MVTVILSFPKTAELTLNASPPKPGSRYILLYNQSLSHSTHSITSQFIFTVFSYLPIKRHEIMSSPVHDQIQTPLFWQVRYYVSCSRRTNMVRRSRSQPPYGPTQQTAAPNSAHTAHPQARDRGQHGHGSGTSAVRRATGTPNSESQSFFLCFVVATKSSSGLCELWGTFF